MDYTFNAFYVMQEMTDYLPELEKGETPKNVYAMWLSDVWGE